MAYWGTECVGLVGSEYRCEPVRSNEGVSVPESVPVSRMDNGFWLEIWVCVVPMSSANECNCQSLSDQQREREEDQRHVQSKGKKDT